MRNNSVKKLTVVSMLLAIIILMAAVPQIGFIQIPILMLSITIMHIPVIIGSLLEGPKVGLLLGAAFGISSWAVAMIRPVLPTDYIFQNPLVSIVPRLLFGLAAYYLFKGSLKFIKNQKVAMSVGAISSTLIHSILVLGSAYIFGTQILTEVYGALPNIIIFLLTMMGVNAIIEALVAAIVAVPVITALQKYLKK
ncbi:MAG TPA: ECF transporter S component [Firmicutes bacterium]|nr:ECF transporter S component [Bacillota bacterium]